MSKMKELEALRDAITEDNAKIDSLALLLRLAEPSMNGEAMERLMYDIGGVIRDYTDRISSALSDLQFVLMMMEDAGKGADAG